MVDLTKEHCGHQLEIGTMTTTEIVYTWPGGREEVHYRRTFGSETAIDMILDVKELQRKAAYGKYESPYSWRHGR